MGLLFHPPGHRPADVSDDFLMLDITGNSQHGIIGLILPGKVIEHHFPVDGRHRLLAAGDIASQSVPGPEKLVDQHGDPLRREVQRHIDFLDDNLTFLFNFQGVEPGIEEDIHQNIQGAVKMRLRHLTPVDGQLFIRAGIEHTPHTLNNRTDLRGGRALRRTFKAHMLDKM